jgi:hypothetical protein
MKMILKRIGQKGNALIFVIIVFLSNNQISGFHKIKFYDLVIISLMKLPHPQFLSLLSVYGVRILGGGKL